MMSMHKLVAGSGYEYLTRQVAAQDDELGAKDSLEEYYSARGEAPGRWLGEGLAAFDDIAAGDVVTGEQMKALWGEGRHPNADAIEKQLIADGHSAQYALAATKLGTPFKIYEGANDFVVALAEAFRDHNLARGEKSAAIIDPEVRAEIRTRVARELFSTQYGRPPTDHRELSGWIAQKSRQKTTAVAGFDLTFSPVKSVSTLWAVAPRDVARLIEDCHHRAVDQTIASLERDIAYTRVGTNGVARVKADGLIAAAFDHRDSRAGDPDLHTHVPISNKVRYTGPDGITRWGALDGKPLHRLAVTASEEYNSRLEAEIVQAFPGARFADRDPGLRGKRPVRELVGIASTLNEHWSARTKSIEARTAELVHAFQAAHGREPTAVEHIALRQQANLDTREGKHEPRSLAEQRAAWHADAVGTLGSETALAAMVAEGLGINTARQLSDPAVVNEVRRLEGIYRTTLPSETADQLINDQVEMRREARRTLAAHGPRRPDQIDPQLWEQHTRRIVRTVAATRSVWQAHHLRAEAMRLGRVLGVGADQLPTFADNLTVSALREQCVQLTDVRTTGDLHEPAMLRNPDGHSMFTDIGLNQFTSSDVLAAERRIVSAAQLTDGHRIDHMHVDVALLEHEANKYPLNAGQQAMVRELATGGVRFHLALAPAGTGKTSAMAAFTTAWTGSGGTVVGLAPTANAAQVLAKDIGQHADTLDKYAWTVQKLREVGDDPLARQQVLDKAPDWFHHIGPGTVILIDEVGMSSTASLDAVVSDALARGADVKAVGDDQQLASVAAGGVLRDVGELGHTLTLTEVMRFTDSAEGAASLAVREGRDEAIGFYVDHHRVHVTADNLAADTAYTAWRRDILNGRDSVMLAPTLDTVRELNQRARADRLADTPAPTAKQRQQGLGRETVLADGLAASVGDTIRTRRNDRRLRLSGTDFVRNGYRWTIIEVGADGTLTVRHDRSNASITLPADYVADQCELGYASTIHGAQGMTVGSRGSTVGTCHVVAGNELDKQLLYVAMTRATDGNHLYFGTSEADPHKIIFEKAQQPPTAVDILRNILNRDGAQVSASTAARRATQPELLIGHAAHSYRYALGSIAEHTLGADVMRHIDDGAGALRDGLTDQSAWPVLRQHLATLAVDRPDPTESPDTYALSRLRAAIESRELDSANADAAVLDWRLDHTGNHSSSTGPLPWLPALTATLADDPDYGPYLHRRSELVTDLADKIKETAAAWTPDTAPRWARPLVLADGNQHQLLGDIAVFRAAHNVDDRDRRPTGPDQYALATRRYQRRLDTAYLTALDTDSSDVTRWRDLATSIDPHIVRDPFWPDLAARLSTAARSGVDVHRLVTDVTADRALPTELPAAALWWRLAHRLEPAVLDSGDSHIRVDWATTLIDVVGPTSAEAIFTDPAWPRLVTAVSAANPTEWTPAALLSMANELLHAGGDGPHVRRDEYAGALAWRVDMLAHHDRHATDIPLPEEHLTAAEEEAAPVDPHASDHLTDLPADSGVDTLGDAAADVDDHYFAALAATEPPTDHDLGDTDHHDELAGIDFADLAADRPAVVLDDHVGSEADLDQLRLAAATARNDADAFRRAILDPAVDTPAVAAAAPSIVELQQHSDRQRPLIAELTNAHHAWIEADLAAETAQSHARDLTQRAAAHPESPELSGIDRSELHAEAELASMQAQTARAAADAAMHRVEQASAALTAAAPNGIITTVDVTRARLTAEQHDLDHLATLRDTARRLDGTVFRAEHQHARRHAAVTVLPRPQRTTPISAAPPVVAGPPVTAVSTAWTRYRDALDRLSRRRITDAAAAFGPHAAATLAADPAAPALASALAAADRAGLDPATALAATAATADTADARGLTDALHSLITDHSIADRQRWRTHHDPAVTAAFPYADHTSSQWDTFVDALHRHNPNDPAPTLAQLHQLAPPLPDEHDLTATLARLDQPSLTAVPPTTHTDDPALVTAALDAHTHLRHTLEEQTTAHDREPWVRSLGEPPTTAAERAAWDTQLADVALYRDLYAPGDTTTTALPPLPADATAAQRDAHRTLSQAQQPTPRDTVSHPDNHVEVEHADAIAHLNELEHQRQLHEQQRRHQPPEPPPAPHIGPHGPRL